jgi:hypothetical protein
MLIRTPHSGQNTPITSLPLSAIRVTCYHILKSAQDVLSLKPGTLDDTSWLRPGYFVWMKSSQGWVPVPDGVKALEGQT